MRSSHQCSLMQASCLELCLFFVILWRRSFNCVLDQKCKHIQRRFQLILHAVFANNKARKDRVSRWAKKGIIKRDTFWMFKFYFLIQIDFLPINLGALCNLYPLLTPCCRSRQIFLHYGTVWATICSADEFKIGLILRTSKSFLPVLSNKHNLAASSLTLQIQHFPFAKLIFSS